MVATNPEVETAVLVAESEQAFVTQKGEEPTAAELAIATLEAHGVEVVFGVPGVHTLALYDALHRSSIRHVLSRHEQGAGFMADGYARATGRPGVAVIITGPGITNVATPVGEAYSDSSPVFILSSNVERAYVDGMRGSLHDLKDQLGVMAAVTQWNSRVVDGSQAAATVAEAMRRLETGRPLPVHVEMPLDVMDEPVPGGRPVVGRGPGPVRPKPELLLEAASRLKAAKRSVIYCGGGAVTSPAPDHILTIAERLGAPVLTSIMGKGSVPEDHPLAIGALWDPGNAVDDLLREADCLLVFGSKLGVQATWDFKLPLPAELIRVDVDPRELTLNARPSLPILGDAALAAEGIEAILSGEEFHAPGFGIERVAAAREAARQTAFGADRRQYIDALRRAVPRDGVVAFDMTMISYASCGLYPAYLPRTFMFPSGYGTLGFALPAAIGAKVGRPEAAVVCVVGDGGFQYTMEEVGAAVQHRIGLPIVIFNDSTYSAVKEAQRRERDGRYLAVDLINPDYVKLAEAYGIPGVRAETPEAMERAIGEAIVRDLPTIVDVPFEPWV
jgi:acetolactate synthase-1/2/3 large subunit